MADICPLLFLKKIRICVFFFRVVLFYDDVVYVEIFLKRRIQIIRYKEETRLYRAVLTRCYNRLQIIAILK